MLTSLPNLLTISRILVIPLVALLLAHDAAFARLAALALFAGACATDYLDGYLARKRAEVSGLGRFLDPIADKLLVAAVLVMLLANGSLTGYGGGLDRKRWLTGWMVVPVMLILGRELLVSGLREYLAELRVPMPVSKLAKWKTTGQMLALGLLIPTGPAFEPWPFQGLGEVCLLLATLLTLITGWDYLKRGLGHMLADGAGARPPESDPSG